MKKSTLWLIVMVFLSLAGTSWAGPTPSLSITGLVKQPLNLSLIDLQAYQSIEVQLNEVLENGDYRGAFFYRGVPLRTLLETACIQKEENNFRKRVDLAILVKNREGKQVMLSWGEVFYKNPGRIIVGLSARPIMPHKDCTRCHKPEQFKPRLNQLFRKIGFPKLVVACDQYANRSLEDITSIQVLNLSRGMPTKRLDKLFSPGFTVTGAVNTSITVTDLSGYPRERVMTRHLGEGKGFHGVDHVEGAPFRSILDKAGIAPDLNTVFLLSAPDGYRSLFSWGEVFLDPGGERIVIADKKNDKPIEVGGRFFFVPPDDLMADRDVKALEMIEVIQVKQTPQVYVIGVGCGDTNLITLEAVSTMARADVFVAPPDIQQQFGKYMGGKPVLMNLYEFAPPVMRKKHPDLSPEELADLLKKEQSGAAAIIQLALSQGKTVAILEYGDPTIWSGWRYAWPYFPEGTIEIIPGISSFNVSNALIGEDLACNGTLIITTPKGLTHDPALVKAIGEKGETLCIFMGLKDVADLVTYLKTGYSGDTPACLVFKAGYSGSESMMKTTLDGLAAAADKAEEKFLGLIYVGPCLNRGAGLGGSPH